MSQIFNLIFNSYVTCRTDSKHRNICIQHTDHGSTPTRIAGAYTYLGGACVSQLEGGRARAGLGAGLGSPGSVAWHLAEATGRQEE